MTENRVSSVMENWSEMEKRSEQLEKFALTLLHQCKGENLSLDELKRVLELMQRMASKVSLRDGLVL